MTTFVNRVTELDIVKGAVNDLLDEKRLVRTPIVNFYGVAGIGKTSVLTRIHELCDERNVSCVQANIEQSFSELAAKITTLCQKYPNPLPSIPESTDEFTQTIKKTQSLLKLESLVLLLDAVDITNEKLIQRLEKMLRELVVYNKLLVILTSRRSISFEHERSVTRKFTALPLAPFDLAGCQEYLDTVKLPFDDPTTRDLIFEWTRGYPLAMKVMVQGLQAGIRSQGEQGQRELIAYIADHVITHGLLAKVKPEDKDWFQRALNLFSVPRRFNLIIMKKLVEEFEPDMKLADNLAYVVLPKKIVQETGIMGWMLEKAGFAIDDPVRNLLLLHLKIIQPDRYHTINRFLAHLNWSNASEDVTELDRVRYQRECLYHYANSTKSDKLVFLLENTVMQIIEGAEKHPEYLINFSEEFNKDEELKEILGSHIVIVLGPLYRKIAEKLYVDYLHETDDEKRFELLYNFFDYTIHNPAEANLSNVLQENLLQLLEREKPNMLLDLYERIGKEMHLQDRIGDEYITLHTLLQEYIDVEEDK